MATYRRDTAALKQFGDRVRERRHELNLSQEDLALRSGLHRNYIGGAERGERNVTLASLLALAAGLECGPDVLVAGLRVAPGKRSALRERPNANSKNRRLR